MRSDGVYVAPERGSDAPRYRLMGLAAQALAKHLAFKASEIVNAGSHMTLPLDRHRI